MRRRDVIGLFGSLPFGNAAGLWRQPVSLRGSGSNEHITQTMAAIADVMFPGDGVQSAAALGAHKSVLEMKDLHQSIARGIAWLDHWATSQGLPDFLALNEARRLAAIDAAFASQGDGMQQFVLTMRLHLGSAYYSQPSVKATFAYCGPPQPDGFSDFQEPPA
jgi:hypothetical protein